MVVQPHTKAPARTRLRHARSHWIEYSFLDTPSSGTVTTTPEPFRAAMSLKYVRSHDVKRCLQAIAAVWLTGVACALGAVVADDSDITVRVQQHGLRIVVDVSVPVDAAVSDTWSVITDYDNMSSF